MDKQAFLLRLLAGVFACQISLLAYEMFRCFQAEHPLAECPQVEQHAEKTFNVMIATTLALLTGSAMSKNS